MNSTVDTLLVLVLVVVSTAGAAFLYFQYDAIEGLVRI
jgi:hypothetical protein